jgi:hypothetical protein
MNILSEPIKDVFLELASKSSESIKLCTPFVKYSVIDELLKRIKCCTKISLITNINLMNFYKKSSDISAVKAIQKNGGEVYNYQKLHAKYYIFDKKYTIITSANLTPSGLSRNYEYGVLIKNEKLINQSYNDYCNICKNRSTGKLDIKNTIQIESILSKIPPASKLEIPKLKLDYTESIDEIYDKGPDIIVGNLTGWKRAVFLQLNLLNKQVFTTSDFNLLIPELKKQYPRNNNIEAKIRQQLQYLRDLGLIKFEGNGIYKKMWIN